MRKSQSCQTVTFIILVTSHYTKAILRIVLTTRKKIDWTYFWKDCNIYLCTLCTDVHKQMRLYKITFYEESDMSNIQTVTVTCIMVETSSHILAIVRCFENKDKKIDGRLL